MGVCVALKDLYPRERILLSDNWDSSWEEKLTQTKDKELYCLVGVCESECVTESHSVISNSLRPHGL